MRMIDGFTKSEIKFMENVPALLRRYDMLHVTNLYNVEFNTELFEDEFHDRFDDYMECLMNPPVPKVESSNESPNMFVRTFLEEHKEQKCPAVQKLLEDYEGWRNSLIISALEPASEDDVEELDNDEDDTLNDKSVPNGLKADTNIVEPYKYLDIAKDLLHVTEQFLRNA